MLLSSKVNKCTNANVYIDGVTYMGRAEEITLPDISPKMVDHKALGMVGESELPAGLGKMTAKIKWNAIYPEVLLRSYNAFSAVRLQVRTSIETWEGGSRIAQQPAAFFLVGTWKKSGGYVFKAQDNVETENELAVTAFKAVIGGVEIVDIDVHANIWRVAGVDQLAQYRANLGI